MSLVRFKKSEQIFDIPCDQIGGHVFRLTFDELPIPEDDILYSGFEILNENNRELVQGDYTNYIYFYRRYKKDPYTIEISDEDIPFDESTNIDNVFPEGGSAEPTFSQIVEMKLQELSSVCNHVITDGLTIDGVHYSYTLEDQLNLESVKNTVSITGLPLGYHANDQDCADYTKEQFLDIYIRLAMNKYCAQTYYNQTRSYLRSLEHTDENKELVQGFVYGTPLPKEYQDNYDHFVGLYVNQIVALGIDISKEEEKPPVVPEDPKGDTGEEGEDADNKEPEQPVEPPTTEEGTDGEGGGGESGNKEDGEETESPSEEEKKPDGDIEEGSGDGSDETKTPSNPEEGTSPMPEDIPTESEKIPEQPEDIDEGESVETRNEGEEIVDEDKLTLKKSSIMDHLVM